MFRPGNQALTWLLWGIATMALLLGVLLAAAFATRHTILHRRPYLLAAVVGFLGWVAFLLGDGEILQFPASSTRHTALAITFLATYVPYLLLAEAIAFCWLGLRKR